jgi:hypothetical protein
MTVPVFFFQWWFDALVRSSSFRVLCAFLQPHSARKGRSTAFSFCLGGNGHVMKAYPGSSSRILDGLLWSRLGFLAHFRQGPVLGRMPILVKGPSSPSIRPLGRDAAAFGPCHHLFYFLHTPSRDIKRIVRCTCTSTTARNVVS